MSRPPGKPVTEDFIPLSDDAVRAVAGPHSRHAALIESAFDLQVETPGGGVRLRGDARGRDLGRRAVEGLAGRIDLGAAVNESDVRAAIAAARSPADIDRPIASVPMRRGVVAAKTKAQADYLEALRSHPLVFGVGPAGTGKTFLAVAYGASLMKAGEVSRLIVTRPAVEAGERLGFLPGDLTEKVDPYMAPIWDALRDLMGEAEVERMREPNPRDGGGTRRDRRAVEVAPIAFMRGRTLNHAFVIVDEAQNCTRAQMKMVLTRLGEGARMAVTGDPSQVDLPHRSDSGLAHAVSLLEGVEGVAVSRFQASDVVRHPLVERIVKAYDADAAGLA